MSLTGTYFAQTESGLLDSCELCTPFMHVMNDMLHKWNKLNHTNLFMNVSSSLFKKFRFVLVIKKKKIWLWLIKKYQICFVICRKKMVFVDKNSDLCLLHKTKSFDFKKY